MDKEDVKDLAVRFEKEYGSDTLLKAAMSAMNKMLVNKGICTQDEIREYLVRELDEFDETLSEEV